MSDCSTEAMQPKEPPKTCGNCEKWVEIPLEGDDIEVGERIGVCQCCWKRWNDRYKRTCKMMPLLHTTNPVAFYCSECDSTVYQVAKFCPSCGAEVVDGD